MIAVSDTGPILYLSLINCTELLPQIFEKVLIPRAVADELSDTATPPKASALIEHKPDWLHICDVPSTDPSLHHLGVGEQQSITLAGSVGADVLLTDDRAAKNFATLVANIAASGTIGVLYEAAMDDLVPFTPADFDESVQRLLCHQLSPYPDITGSHREPEPKTAWGGRSEPSRACQAPSPVNMTIKDSASMTYQKN
jgi:predicted nucleic acid-binding protein